MVKNIKVIILAVIAIVLFVAGAAFEKFGGMFIKNDTPLKITTRLESEVKLTPTLFEATHRFYARPILASQTELDSATKSQAAALFGELGALVGAGQCDLSGYSITPRYSYENGAQSLAGHSLNGSLSCRVDGAGLAAYNELMAKIEAAVAKSEIAALSVGELTPQFTSEQVAQNKEALRSDIIKTATAFAAQNSEQWGKKCEVKTLDFDGVSMVPRALKAANAGVSDTAFSAALPSIKEVVQSASARAVVECW